MIRNEVAYQNAIRLKIIMNAQKTWFESTPRANEIHHAICTGEGQFIESMRHSFNAYGKLTEKQCIAILKGIDSRKAKLQQWEEERNAKKTQEALQSDFVGSVGEKVTLTLTVQKIIALKGIYGTSLLCICKDTAGNVIIYKGTADFPQEGCTATITATVKVHNLREGVKQTFIQRPRIVKIKAEEEESEIA